MELEWSESFKKGITTTISRIDDIFKDSCIDNSVNTLDFTFFFPEHEDKSKWNILIYQYAPREYVKILDSLYEKNGFTYAKFADKTKVVKDLNSSRGSTNTQPEFHKPQELNGKILNAVDFTPDEWHGDLERAGFGKASIVVSREYKDEMREYEIQAGVYLILKENFGCFPEDTYESKNDGRSIDDITGHDEIRKVVKEIWLILENLLFDEMFEILVGKFKSTEIEREHIKLKRNQQRTINHYLRPIFTGIGLTANDIQAQIDRAKTDEAKLGTKVLQLQAEILEHHFKIGQRLEDLVKQHNYKGYFRIGFQPFFEYLYIRNFFTGSHINIHAIKFLNDDEYDLAKRICTTSLHDFFESNSNFDTTVNTLFSKLSDTSSFKLLFRGQTSKMFIELPKSEESMNVVIKFSSAFIENFKKFWWKDDYFSEQLGREVYSFLIIYSRKSDIFFFQNKENQGWIEYSINLPEDESEEYYESAIEAYIDGFKDYASEMGLGNNDLKALLHINDIQCSSQTKDVVVINVEDGEPKIEKGAYLYFKRLILNNNSALIKK